MGHVQGQCGDVEERHEQARRTTEAVERSTEEGSDGQPSTDEKDVMEQDVVTEMEAIEVSDDKEETVEGDRQNGGRLVTRSDEG